jgi:cupin superfamily acireductone dioxygenase involved in methionine salvage
MRQPTIHQMRKKKIIEEKSRKSKSYTTMNFNKDEKKIFENKAVTNEESEMNVLLTLQENPYLSYRQMEAQLDVSKSSVNRILRKHKYHPYHHISLHQDHFQKQWARQSS